MAALEDAKLELFCQERAKAGATDVSAYVAAGYAGNDPNISKKLTRLLKDIKVSARIAQIHVEAAAGNGLTQERVEQQLANVALTNMTDVVEWGSTVVRSQLDQVTGERRVVIVKENWIRLVDSSKMESGAGAALERISRNADGEIIGVKMRSPMPALVVLAKHLGISPGGPKHGVYGANSVNGAQTKPMVYVDSGPRETLEEWEARVRRRIEGNGTNQQKEGAPTENPSR